MNCKRCNKEIPQDRLEALPETELCVKCSDKVGGDYVVNIAEENIGSFISARPVIYKTKREITPIK